MGTREVVMGTRWAHGARQGLANLQHQCGEDRWVVGCTVEPGECRWAACSRVVSTEGTGRASQSRLERGELGRGSALAERAGRFDVEDLPQEVLARAAEAAPSPGRLGHGGAPQGVPQGTVVGPVRPAALCAASACKRKPWIRDPPPPQLQGSFQAWVYESKRSFANPGSAAPTSANFKALFEQGFTKARADLQSPTSQGKPSREYAY